MRPCSRAGPDEVTTYPYTPVCTSSSDCAGIQAPDGGATTNWYYSVNPEVNAGQFDSRSGMVWKIQKPNSELTERYWLASDPSLDPGSSAPGGNIYQNPRVKTEYITLSGKTRVKAYQYDANGNMSSVAEYDWAAGVSIPRDSSGAPSGLASGLGTLVRTTSTAYLYGDGTSSDCSGTSAPYWSTSSQAFRSAVCTQQVQTGGSGPLASRVEYTYGAINSSFPLSLALTEQRRWSSAKGGLGSCTITAPCLSSTNAAVTDYGYDTYGACPKPPIQSG